MGAKPYYEVSEQEYRLLLYLQNRYETKLDEYVTYCESHKHPDLRAEEHLKGLVRILETIERTWKHRS